ncbi:MAG: hypothetical protein IJ829_06070, partial [Kiritimatiellae bacterium]|nr:hypothetical protein [Kiritimatiellia bacterium]
AGGTFYGAGGGSGALYTSGNGGNGGAGYQGVVIVRFTDYSQAGDAPLVEILGVTGVGTDAATLAVSVPYAGSADDAVTLTVNLSYEEGASPVETKTLADFIGSQTISLSALSPGRTYHVTVAAAATTGTTTATTSFTTAPMFSTALAYTAAGGKLGYTIDGAASADSQRLELWVGADAASRTLLATYADASLMTAGSHTLQPFAAEQFGETVSILLRHVAVVGDLAFTNDTAALSTTLTDGATYTWKSDVHEGDWCNADNWTASAAGGRGFPVVGSTAKFPNAVVTCRVDRAIGTLSSISFSGGGDYRFVGTDPGASIVTGVSGDSPFAAAHYVFDAIVFNVTSTGQNGFLGSNKQIELANGATFRITPDKEFTMTTGGGESLTVGEGCLADLAYFGGHSGATALVCGGTLNVRGNLNLSNRGAATKNPMWLTIRGASSRVTLGTGNFYSQNTNATVTVELANEAYSTTDALVKQTGGSTKMANSGYTLTFEAPQTAGSKRLSKCDILVADWTRSSINAALVEFGAVDREGSYFYFTETADPKGTQYKSAAEVSAASATVKCLWYHHASAPGLTIRVR